MYFFSQLSFVVNNKTTETGITHLASNQVRNKQKQTRKDCDRWQGSY